MSNRRGTGHKRCPRCRVNQEHCFCDRFFESELQTRVSVVMHYKEEHLTSNTAYMARQVLSNSEIITRGRPQSDDSAVLHPGYSPILLYPSDDAAVLDADFVKGINGPIQLIVPDGSWRQARKYRQRVPGLSDIPAVKLEGDFQSNYGLRKTPFEGALCTYEAIMHALRIIDPKGEELFSEMEGFFKHFVMQVLKTRNIDPLRYREAMVSSGLEELLLEADQF